LVISASGFLSSLASWQFQLGFILDGILRPGGKPHPSENPIKTNQPTFPLQ
jgi:hypothetical protein